MKGNLTRRGRHSWRLKFDAGRDPATGKRLTKYITLKGTKAEAQRQAATALAGAVTGEFVDVTRETVAQFVERWLRDWCASNISAKTLERYRELLRVHLIGRVGAVPIQKLRAADLQRVYAAMAEAALADRTRLHLHRVTHRMLKHAVQWGVITRNPAALVDAPSVRSTEVGILTPQQLKAVLETLRGRSLYPIASLALASGMRRGELLALRWQDINLDGGTLRVERSLEQTKAGLVFKAPKTGHGRRTITLPPSTVAEIKAHRMATLERRLALGLGKVAEDALVFETWDCQTRSPNALTKEWSRAMKAAGLEATFHSLRHTHASTLIAAGIDVLTISRRLGHGSPAITLGVYGHLIKTDDRAAEAMEQALKGVE